jgi:Flp pilus assembly pilin Flp
MTKALALIKRFAADQNGSVMVEYSILIGIFAAAIIGIMVSFGNWMTTQWQTVCTLVKFNCLG